MINNRYTVLFSVGGSGRFVLLPLWLLKPPSFDTTAWKFSVEDPWRKKWLTAMWNFRTHPGKICEKWVSISGAPKRMAVKWSRNGSFFQPWDSWVAHFQAKPDAWMRRNQQHCFSEWHTLDFTRGQDHVLKQSLKHSSYELYRISLKLQEFYSLRKCNSHHNLVVTKQAISIGENWL